MHLVSNHNRHKACQVSTTSRVSSGGILPMLEEPQWWFKQPAVLLQCQMVVIFSAIGAVRAVLKHLGVSIFSCQLLTGLIFGCSWKRYDTLKLKFFTPDSEDALALFAYFGHILYLFISGVKLDALMAVKTDRKALMIGISTVIVPLVTAYTVAATFSKSIPEPQKQLLPILISVYIQTAFPVISSLVNELKIVNTELGRLSLSSAMAGNMFSLMVLIISCWTWRFQMNPTSAPYELAGITMLFGIILFVFRAYMLGMVKHTPTGKSVGQSSIKGVIFFVVLSCFMFSFTPTSGLTGPLILGLAVPEAAPLVTTLVNRAEIFVMSMIMPILVVTCALRVDLSAMSTLDTPFARLNVLLFWMVNLSKVITGLLSSLQCKLPLKEALAISLILVCKGVVELVLMTLALDSRCFSSMVFSCLTLGILALATVVPIGVRLLYDPSTKYICHQNRNILHLDPHSEFRVLSCVYQDENVHGIIQLLKISCPTVDNPIAVYVFHIIELPGRTTPIFISHSLQRRTTHEEHSYSENVVLSFEHYERDSNETVHAECFTAVSPNKFLQDNICTLALNNETSLIVLPFHRTWTADGFLAEDDNNIRILNCSVLERAPCSVGILVSRGNIGSTSPIASSRNGSKYAVCVMYLGGDDDRETISYAQRMARDSRVELTVLRLKSMKEDESNNWENMLNSEILRHFKSSYVDEGYARFIEEICEEGPETALKIREMVNDYDLIMVGRRYGVESPQTTGLSAWIEFPELGILGDLLISADINRRASVLIIQHQIKLI